MTVHVLKAEAPYYDAAVQGKKTFEVRRDDRGFQAGDIVKLQRLRTDGMFKTDVEYSSGKVSHEIEFSIGWILTGGQFGIEPGYVVFSLESIAKQDQQKG